MAAAGVASAMEHEEESAAAPDGIPISASDGPSLLAAAMHGFADVVVELLAAGADPDVRQPPSQNSCLHLAALSGQAEVVKVLLEAGLPAVDCTNAGGDSSLMFAASRGFVGVALRLIKAGASLTHSNRSGLTPLMVAASAGQALMVQALLRSAAQQVAARQANDAGDKAGAAGGSLVLLILTQTDEHGNCALHYAARTGFTSVVEALLEAGASCTILARNVMGRTPLVEAKLSGNKACVAAIESRLQPSASDAVLLQELAPHQVPAASKTPAQHSHPHQPERTAITQQEGATSVTQQEGATVGAGTAPDSNTASQITVDPTGHAGSVGSQEHGVVLHSPNTVQEPAPVASQAQGTSTPLLPSTQQEPGIGAVPLDAAAQGSTDAVLAAQEPSNGIAAEAAQDSSSAWTSVNKRSGRISAHHQSASTSSGSQRPATKPGSKSAGAHGSAHSQVRPAATTSGPTPASQPSAGSSSQGAHSHTANPGLPPGSIWAKAPPPGMAPRAAAGPPPGISTSSAKVPSPSAAALGPPPGILSPVLSPGQQEQGSGSNTAAPTASRARSPGWSGSGAGDWVSQASMLLQAEFPEAAALDILPQHVLGVGLDELSYSQLEALEVVHQAALKRLGEARLALVREQERARMLESARLQNEVARLRAQIGVQATSPK